MEYKRNQIEEAIFRTFGAREERRNELKFRIKRLLVTDRRLGRNVKSHKKRIATMHFLVRSRQDREPK